jgi:hypothetical protein
MTEAAAYASPYFKTPNPFDFFKQIALADDLMEARAGTAIKGNGAQPKMFRKLAKHEARRAQAAAAAGW